MSKAIGRTLTCGIAKEAARGTAEATPAYWIRNTEPATVQDKVEHVKADFTNGTISEASDSFIGKRWAEGEVKGPVGDKSVGLIELATMGGVTSTPNSPEAGVTTHAFDVLNDNQHPSLTLFIDAPAEGADRTHALAMADSVEVSAEIGKHVEFSMSVKAKKGASATLTPALVTENYFKSTHIALKFASALSGLNAATAVTVTKTSIKREKNLEEAYVLGSDEPSDIYNKEFVVTGMFEALVPKVDLASFRSTFTGGASQAIRLEMKNTSVTIGTATNPMIQYDMAKCFFEELSVNNSMSDVAKVAINFRAVLSLVDGKQITTKLINTVTSY